MITFSEYPIDASFDPEVLASNLGMNWDSVNSVLYMGTDKTNGFKLTIAATSVTVNSWINGTSTGANTAIYTPIRYIFNDDGTACAWGGSTYDNAIFFTFLWAKAKSPNDNNNHYIFCNTSGNQSNGSRTLWTLGGTYEGFFSKELYKASMLVSFCPLAVEKMSSTGYPDIPLYCENVYIEVVGIATNLYQAITLDGYDYLILSNMGGQGANMVRPALPIGSSS